MTTKKMLSTLTTTVLTTALAFVAVGSATTRVGVQHNVSTNGMSLNGVILNGMSVNGIILNGLAPRSQRTTLDLVQLGSRSLKKPSAER